MCTFPSPTYFAVYVQEVRHIDQTEMARDRKPGGHTTSTRRDRLFFLTISSTARCQRLAPESMQPSPRSCRVRLLVDCLKLLASRDETVEVNLLVGT
jgi:hypothetical protein